MDELVTSEMDANENPDAEQAPQDEPFDLARAQATIKKLREFEKQAKQQAKELAALKLEDEERKRAAMSESERLKADLEAARKALEIERTERVRATIRAHVAQAAADAGMYDPQDAMGHLGRLELDDDGQIPDLGKRLDELKARKPYLFKGQATTISPTNPLGSPQPQTEAQVLSELFGRRNNKLFDGGGVVWVQKPD